MISRERERERARKRESERERARARARERERERERDVYSNAFALTWYLALTWYRVLWSPPRTHFEPWKAVGTRGRGSLAAW